MNRWIATSGTVAAVGILASIFSPSNDPDIGALNGSRHASRPLSAASQRIAIDGVGKAVESHLQASLGTARRPASPIEGPDPFAWIEPPRAPDPVVHTPPSTKPPPAVQVVALPPTEHLTRHETPVPPPLEPLAPVQVLGRILEGGNESVWVGLDGDAIEAAVGLHVDPSRRIIDLQSDRVSIRDSRDNAIEVLTVPVVPEGIVLR